MISLLDIQRKGFLGKIVFGESVIHWEYSHIARCECNSIGVKFVQEELIGKTVDSFDLIDNQNHVSLIFNFEDETSWEVLFYNNSTSNCYVHYLEIFENGKLIWNLAL